MQIFVTGAAGYLGSRVLDALGRHGHKALGLVRSDKAATQLRDRGHEAIVGDLDDMSALAPVADATDGVIHTAFGHGIDFMAAVQQERRAVAAFIEALAGTGKPLVVSTATGVVGDTGPEPVDEAFPGQPDFPARVRMAVEEDARAAASRGVRAVVVRPAILLHGHGASRFVPMLVAAARRTGVVGFPGPGTNRIAAAHVDDLAELFVLAAERAPAGALYNGAGGDVSTRELAEAIVAGNPGLRAASFTPEEATAAWGPFPAMLLGLNNRTSGARARAELSWRPYETTPTLTDDLATGSYAKADASVLA